MYLLDTNVVSELRKESSGQANKSVVKWARQHIKPSFFISVMTLYELEIGVLRILRKDNSQGQNLRHWLDHQVLPFFQNRILSVTPEIVLCCAKLHIPNPSPERDAMIAATALTHNMTIVTRNIKDFHGTGAKLLNPWETEL